MLDKKEPSYIQIDLVGGRRSLEKGGFGLLTDPFRGGVSRSVLRSVAKTWYNET